MSKVYLPENVYTVCPNQKDPGTRQFTLAKNDIRPVEAKTVKLGSQSRTFLVKIDRNLSENFVCKTNWVSDMGTAYLNMPESEVLDTNEMPTMSQEDYQDYINIVSPFYKRLGTVL